MDLAPALAAKCRFSLCSPKLATAPDADGECQPAVKGWREPALRLDAKALEALVEAGELAAAVDQTLLPAGPRRMRLRVDIEAQRVARLAVGRACLVGASIGH